MIPMRDYVRNTLDREMGRVSSNSIEAEAVEELQKLVIEKEDGVFMWVSFALQSLLSGTRNNQDFEVLMGRLVNLPSEVTQLYQHMWHRLTEDEKRYRQEASFSIPS